ncbi:Techylectin-5B-like protein [Dinothrombium tinctorium]|uniref:Techylectin-5B-like protein n=1 Tax=Dinothrombium tinctorium TaxID=1965070 RepID=A0A443RFE0_9ACAR|nr:Techylectin-5B-like protein [Dinothrombium tinctorium]
MARYHIVLNVILMVLNTLLICECQRRNSTARGGVIKDIHGTVNDIYDMVYRNELNLRMVISNIAIVQSKVERTSDTLDLNKVNDNLIIEKLTKLENRLKSVEDASKQMIETIVNKMSTFETRIIQLDESIDGKLRKMNNVLTQVYEFSKDVKNVFENSKNDERRLDDEPTLNELKKDIKEQMSVLGVEIKSHLSTLGSNTLNLRGQLDIISSQLLQIQDDMPKSNGLRTQSSQIYASAASSSNIKCPAINTTDIMKSIDFKHIEVLNKIESEANRIGSKVETIKCISQEKDNNNENKRYSRPNASPNDGTIRRINTIRPSDGGRFDSCTKITNSIEPQNCYQLRKNGATCDGVYRPEIQRNPTKVYCDMNDAGGGWTVIMRRGRFSESRRQISFNQSWDGYKDGFGDFLDEFWLGNDLIHSLTTSEPNELQIDLEAFDGDFISLQYEHFSIANENNNYTLSIGRPKGSAKQQNVAYSFCNHDKMPFSTYDKNLSGNMINCAASCGGGWWFDMVKCHYVFLNAPYSGSDENNGREALVWRSWKGIQKLKAVQMKIRPKL